MHGKLNPENYLSPEEARRELKIGHNTLFRWIREGKLQVIKLPSTTLIPKSEVDRLNKSGG